MAAETELMSADIYSNWIGVQNFVPSDRFLIVANLHLLIPNLQCMQIRILPSILYSLKSIKYQLLAHTAWHVVRVNNNDLCSRDSWLIWETFNAANFWLQARFVSAVYWRASAFFETYNCSFEFRTAENRYDYSLNP